MSEIQVLSRTQTIIVDSPDSIRIVNSGPPGPPGPPGDTIPGSGDLHYTHVQDIPSTLWSVAHNLGKRPSVTITDSAGTVFIGDINHVDENNLTVEFTAAFSGLADCN